VNGFKVASQTSNDGRLCAVGAHPASLAGLALLQFVGVALGLVKKMGHEV